MPILGPVAGNHLHELVRDNGLYGVLYLGLPLLALTQQHIGIKLNKSTMGLKTMQEFLGLIQISRPTQLV